VSQLESYSRIVQSPEGVILEISFRGIHEWTHGAEMNRYMEAQVTEVEPVAVLFNLLDYEYVAGNDVTALFTASFYRWEKGFPVRPVCIAATGTTHRSLYQFFESTQVRDAFGIDFVPSVELGLLCLKERLVQER
jgi:hypothetical protein